MSDMNASNQGLGNLLGIGSLVTGGLGAVGNFASQMITNAQNERLMREAWGREDTAVQRRAADMEAAGLSKTLAAGNAASTMAPIKLSAPELHMNPIDDYMKAKTAAMNLKSVELQHQQQRADIARTNANTEWLISQKNRAEAEAPEKLEKLKFENYFKDQTMEPRIAYTVAHANNELLKEKNIQADTRLKEFGITKGRIDAACDLAWGAYATGKNIREADELAMEKKEKRIEYAPGGAYDTALQRAAVDLRAKEILLDELEKKHSKIPYNWRGLGRGADDLLDWLLKGE